MKQFFTLSYWKGQRILLLVFLLLHIVIASIHISQEGITVDEPDYYTYAARWAHGNVERTDKMYDSKTPIVAVALIPRIIQQLQEPGYKATDYGNSDILKGRYFMVIFTIIISLYLFAWIRKLFGAAAWIMPMLFFLFDPLIISFSMIITSDMASGACMIATMYHLYRFFEQKQLKQFIIFSLWLGVAFVCKASLLFLLPCLGILYLVLLASGVIKFRLKRLLLYTALMLSITLLVINLAYFGKDSFHSLKNIPLKSETFQSIASNQLLNKIPIPLPANYVESLDLLQYHTEIGAGKPGSSYPGVFLNGVTKYKGGFWNYYLYVGFYKIPVAILFLLLTGFITLIWRFRTAIFFKNYVWFAVPALFFCIVLSCFNSFQLGIRHLLIIYPLFFIGIAAAIHYWQKRFWFSKYISIGLLVWMLISVTAYFPNLLAYTNEFLIDKKNVFRKIKDASIDYGQTDTEIEKYVQQYPGISIPQKTPKPGKYIVTMMQLFDEGPGSTNTNKYLWLLQFEPVSHHKYSTFIFDISQKDIQQLQNKSRP